MLLHAAKLSGDRLVRNPQTGTDNDREYKFRWLLGTDELGIVHVGAEFQAEEPFDYHGYIIDETRESDSAGWMLPIVVERIDGVTTDSDAPLRVRLDEQGAPLTAKVGCAWYTGTPSGCRTLDRFFGHPHDFEGSIGLRCAVSL